MSNSSNSMFIHHCLYEISRMGKSILFKDFLIQLKDLRYKQFIIYFVRSNPEGIETLKNIISIFDFNERDSKINSKYLDLLYGDNILIEFKELLEGDDSKASMISVFYQHKPELNKEFTDLIEDYYRDIDFGISPTEDHCWEYHSVLFYNKSGVILEFSESFFIKKLTEYLSNDKNQELFNPESLNLVKYFDKLDSSVQKVVIDLLIRDRRFGAIGFLIKHGSDKFHQYIDRFLGMTSDNESDIRQIIEIFKTIIRIYSLDQHIEQKIKEKLYKLPNTHDKGLYLSFLGEKSLSLTCFLESLNKEISISQKIIAFVDYLTVYFDVYSESLSMSYIEEFEDDLTLLEEDFNNINIIKESKNKFPFKFQFLRGRYSLFKAVYDINLENFNDAKEKLTESYNIFKELSESEKIPYYNKEILMIYANLSLKMSKYLNKIKNHIKRSHFEKLHKEFCSIINKIDFNFKAEDIKTVRIRESLDNFSFNEKGILKQLQFELPINYCPIPPAIESIYIKFGEDKEELNPWDNRLELKSTFEPLTLTKSLNKLEIVQVFIEKNQSYPYILEFEKKFDFIQTYFDGPIVALGENRFPIYIGCDSFYGTENIRIQLKSNDKCLVGIDLNLPIRNYEHSFFNKKEMTNENIIDSYVSTTTDESTNFLKNEIRKLINQVNISSKRNLQDFFKIICKLANWMHSCDDVKDYIHKSANEFWEKNKDKRSINMEVHWFHLKLYDILKENFKLENVKKEPETTFGNVDFLVYNIPVEAKCYYDTNCKNTCGKSGLDLITEEESQGYQYAAHTNLVIMIAYDYREKQMKKDLLNQAITERIRIESKGNKLMCKMIIIRKYIPSSIKNFKDCSDI